MRATRTLSLRAGCCLKQIKWALLWLSMVLSWGIMAENYRHHLPDPAHPLTVLDQKYYARFEQTTGADQRAVVLAYAQEVQAYLAQQNVAVQLVEAGPKPIQIYLEISPGEGFLNDLAAQVTDQGFKLVFSPWRNLVHKIYNCKGLYVDFSQTTFFLGTWYLADPDFYASPIKHNLNLIAQYQRKVPVYLEAATLLTSGITELARLPRPLYTKGHARITLYPDARIFVPRTLRPKTEFAAYLGRTLNLYQTWQEIQKAIPGSKTWANSIGHLRRSYFKLSFEVASRLAEINLIIYHLMEEGRAVNFQVHERYHCLEIVVAPVDYLAGFYYSLYLPFQEAKVPTTKAEILQLKILQDLYFYLYQLHRELRQMRPLLTSFQEGNLKKFSPLYHQILKLCAVAPSLTTVHPEPRFREIWQSRLSANQNSIRRSLTDAVNFFNEQNNCAANFTAVPSSSKYLTGKRPMAPKDGNLSFVAQRFSAKNPPAPARPWFSWAKSWQNFWQAWWKKSPQ